jgi:hypothetical protein
MDRSSIYHGLMWNVQVLGQRMQAKMQFLQSNLDNLNNARHEVSKHFRNYIYIYRVFHDLWTLLQGVIS